MQEVLGWTPLVYVLRALCLAIALLVALVTVALWIRAMRFVGLVILARASLPPFSEFAASAKLAGQEFALSAKLDSERDEQLKALDERLRTLEDTSRRQAGAIETIIHELLEEPDDAW